MQRLNRQIERPGVDERRLSRDSALPPEVARQRPPPGFLLLTARLRELPGERSHRKSLRIKSLLQNIGRRTSVRVTTRHRGESSSFMQPQGRRRREVSLLDACDNVWHKYMSPCQGPFEDGSAHRSVTFSVGSSMQQV